MNVIISKTLEDNYKNFKVLRSLREAKAVSPIDVMILHTFEEASFDAGLFISHFHKHQGLDKFLYICKEPVETVSIVFRGMEKCRIYTDEFYYSDEAELEALIEDTFYSDNTVTTELAAPSLNIVKSFIEAFEHQDPRIKTPVYLEQVASAVNELSVLTHQQELQIVKMGASAIDIFSKASIIIKNMGEQQKLNQQYIDELQTKLANSNDGRASFGSSIAYFPPYSYTGTAKVLVFREYAPTRYLTSFCLAYNHYLRHQKNLRVKLIFIHQRGAGVAAKYSDFASITQDSASYEHLYDADVVATNNPKKEVLKTLFSKPVDVFLVVDRLYGSPDTDIVNGRVQRVNVVSSRSDVKRYNVDPKNTIFSVVAQPPSEQLFCLSTVKQFPPDVGARFAAYAQIAGSYYEILNKKLGI